MTVLGLSLLQGVLGALVMGLGAALQGAVGFGCNLVAAPLLLLIDERYVPGPVIVASFLLNLLVTRREGRAAIHEGIRSANVGQVVGVSAAFVVLRLVSTDGLSLLFAALVLAAVGLSAAGWHVPTNPRTLTAAGATAGFMGTISGIGGPPIALVYQHLPPASLRSTLARFFLLGGVLSMTAVALAGRLGRDELVPVLSLLPGTVAGFMVSGWLQRHVEGRAVKHPPTSPVRPIVLALSAISAVAVLLRAIL